LPSEGLISTNAASGRFVRAPGSGCDDRNEPAKLGMARPEGFEPPTY
ncbi:MAG: hypothetical protein QOI52_1076, partial [Chloroflexota bacterium]|nr:hypothetical protein [Chloroflexota bacterium]